MITYPSTHGVFEETVRGGLRITHEHGGQVYLDGANLNAMVGLARPGDIGADVSHLNLHKTFCIPHGGGGPGMGPIGVKAHLAPHLPGHPEMGGGMVRSRRALWLGVDPADLLGLCLPDGRRGPDAGHEGRDPECQLHRSAAEGAYDVLFTGRRDGWRMNASSTRVPSRSAGVTVDDIAKRLMDCGFHAPTMSWPVAGTLMIEPTESEVKAELDRFCAAMLAIRDDGIDRDNNPLKNAPHTIEDLVGPWDRPYDREAAIFPAGAMRNAKYFAPVNRVDNVYPPATAE
jgi:glycine dehydrogenase